MAGNWKLLTHQPTFNASTMLLLTDGTVMCQQVNTKFWWKLTPDAFGSYLNGTWSALAPMNDARLYYASAVLRDGRVFVAGGEYAGTGAVADLNKAEIYDPVANSWTPIPTPPGWTAIGDAACCLLEDGRVMIGSIFDSRTAIYDPTTNAWHATGNALDRTNEETWTLLSDGSVLSVECFNIPQSERYIPASGTWISAGATPSPLVENSSKEIGPAVLMNDGRVLCIGATGTTATYHLPHFPIIFPSWHAGPSFPLDNAHRQLGAKDAPAVLLPNGKVLCAVGPVDGVAGDYLGPTSFFEFDPVHNTLTQVPSPANAGGLPFNGRMLLTPSGEVLFTSATSQVSLYIPDGHPDAAWKPSITSYPHSVFGGSTYTLQGRQLNGLSQACSYGDDATMATNYPIIRLREPGTNKIHYCRTFGHSTMGVATGTHIHSTNFRVPLFLPGGWMDLSVIANGIASDEVRVFYTPFHIFHAIADLLTNPEQLSAAPTAVYGSNGPITLSAEGDANTQAIAQEAQKARESILAGIKSLRDLGSKMEGQIIAASLSNPGEPVKVGEDKSKEGMTESAEAVVMTRDAKSEAKTPV